MSIKQAERCFKSFRNSSPKNSEVPLKKLQIYVKILINHLQIISIINYFQLNWPYDVSIFLNNFSGVSMASGVFSLSCILSHYNLDVHSIYVETAVLLMIPILVYLIALTIFALSYFKTKHSQSTRFISMSIALNILLQPSMIRKFSESVTCQQIDNTYYLVSDMEIDYNSDFHQTWVILKFHFPSIHLI